MIRKDLADAIKAKIETDFTVCEKRVYHVLSNSDFSPDMYGFPFVSIVVRPTTPKKFQLGEQINEHEIDVLIFTSVYTEESTVIGDTDEEGLLELSEDLYVILKNEKFCTELNNKIFFTDVKTIFGTQDVIEIGGKGYSGLTGLKMIYWEQE